MGHYKGFWRTDAPPLAVAVLMLLALLAFAVWGK